MKPSILEKLCVIITSILCQELRDGSLLKLYCMIIYYTRRKIEWLILIKVKHLSKIWLEEQLLHGANINLTKHLASLLKCHFQESDIRALKPLPQKELHQQEARGGSQLRFNPRDCDLDPIIPTGASTTQTLCQPEVQIIFVENFISRIVCFSETDNIIKNKYLMGQLYFYDQHHLKNVEKFTRCSIKLYLAVY